MDNHLFDFIYQMERECKKNDDIPCNYCRYYYEGNNYESKCFKKELTDYVSYRSSKYG